MDSFDVIAVDGMALPWEERPNPSGKVNYAKKLFIDPQSGMEVRLIRYPAGVVVTWHTHPCGHGIYVLEGRLRTHDGVHGPGSFVWFPAGALMEHGATDAEDVTVLFITNGPFDINFRDPPHSEP